MKTCTKCGETKARDAFSAYWGHSDRVRSECKACVVAGSAIWAAKNPDRKRANSARAEANNKSKRRDQRRVWHAKNRDSRNALSARLRVQVKPGYVGVLLGIPASQLTPELLELKREQLTVHRLAKQVKQQLKKETK